jgi:hypothetical protein
MCAREWPKRVEVRKAAGDHVAVEGDRLRQRRRLGQREVLVLAGDDIERTVQAFEMGFVRGDDLDLAHGLGSCDA